MKNKVKGCKLRLREILLCLNIIMLICGYIAWRSQDAFLIIASLFSIFLMFLYSLVHLALKSKFNRRSKAIILLCLVAILYIGYTKTRYVAIIPAINFVFVPDDYYEPLISEEFIFHKKGYSKVYLLPYKYPKMCAVKLIRAENDLSKINGLTGKLKAEFFYKDQLLFEKVSTDSDPCLTNRSIELIEFAMPLNNKYRKNISVKLTVLEPYIELEKLEKLFVEIGGAVN